MQKCNVFRHAAGLCFCLVLLIFAALSSSSLVLNLKIKTFFVTMLCLLGCTANSRVNLPHGLDIDRVILNGHAFAPQGTLALLGLGHTALTSAAEIDTLTSCLAAFGIKR